MFKLPKCRHCGRNWKPADAVSATEAFCDECYFDRRQVARRHFGSDINPEQRRFVGGYVLPAEIKRRKKVS